MVAAGAAAEAVCAAAEAVYAVVEAGGAAAVAGGAVEVAAAVPAEAAAVGVQKTSVGGSPSGTRLGKNRAARTRGGHTRLDMEHDCRAAGRGAQKCCLRLSRAPPLQLGLPPCHAGGGGLPPWLLTVPCRSAWFLQQLHVLLEPTRVAVHAAQFAAALGARSLSVAACCGLQRPWQSCFAVNAALLLLQVPQTAGLVVCGQGCLPFAPVVLAEAPAAVGDSVR